jgi:hypothetical protein
MVFPEVELPERIRELVSDIHLRKSPSRQVRTREIRLITEADIRRQILTGQRISDLLDVGNVLAIEEGMTYCEVHAHICLMMKIPPAFAHFWRVSPNNMPTVTMPKSGQRFPNKDMALFMQLVRDTDPPLDKDSRMAFISFFFPRATTRVQFVTATPFHPSLSITQLFPIIDVRVGVGRAQMNVFCDELGMSPIDHDVSLVDQGLSESTFLVAEAVLPVETTFEVEFMPQQPEAIISYFSKVRSDGDLNATHYMERQLPHLEIEICALRDLVRPLVTVSVPETMPITELPGLIIFATYDPIDSTRDTIQIFKGRPDPELMDIAPAVLRADLDARIFFGARGRNSKFRVSYDVVRGSSEPGLDQMVIRTCDIYDKPLHRSKRIRLPMLTTQPLSDIIDHIDLDEWQLESGRLLVDEAGIVRLIDLDEDVPPSSLLRFERMPLDQVDLRPGEFLVSAVFYQDARNQTKTICLNKSFMFRIVPGELAEDTLRRISQYHYFRTALLPLVELHTAERILNKDERLDEVTKPNDRLKIVLPHRLKAGALLRKAGCDDPSESLIHELGDAE